MNDGGRSRFGRIESRTPEGRLTEMLALCLEANPELAAAVVERWTGWQVEKLDFVVETEVASPNGKFIDLEIAPRHRAGPRLWVEVKRDLLGESSENQLQNYIDGLTTKCQLDNTFGQVVYLPRAEVSDPKPSETEQVTYAKTDWAEFGRFLEKHPSSDRLTEDFVKFLREEFLCMEAITEGDLGTLKAGAHQRFSQLLKEASKRVRDEARDRFGLTDARLNVDPDRWVMGWGDSTHRDQSSSVPPAGCPGGGQILFEWNLCQRTGGECDDQIAFAAGLTWHRRDQEAWSSVPGAPTRLCDSRGDPFERYSDDLPRLYRWLRPEDLVRERTFEEQVKRLSEFVIDSFEDCLDALTAEGPQI